MKNAIVIGGTGMVGNATMYSLGIKDQYSRSKATVKLEQIMDFKYIFICLPTPTVNGEQDISSLTQFFEMFKGEFKDNIFIIRSTVLPGVCRSFSQKYGVKIVHAPEFLTESTWKKDSEWPDIVVIGADDEGLREEVAGIFKSRYKGAAFFLTDTVTSETIKYAINTLYALKVIFANEVFDFCQKTGINYETVKGVLYSRKWIGKNHLDVWHKGGRGVSGKCLKKDLEAFARLSGSKLLRLAAEINSELVRVYPKNESNPETT